MNRVSTIELFKEDMKFSAGHFTIFSATERERLHGHDFRVFLAIKSTVNEEGLVVDYGIYKSKLCALCREWNEYFLLPERSPHLSFTDDGSLLQVRFADETIPFLLKDVLLLPITNTSVEELSSLILSKVVQFRNEQGHEQIFEMTVKVFSGPGQSGSAEWAADASV